MVFASTLPVSDVSEKNRGSNSCTLQGTNISHLGNRKIIFKMSFFGDMLVPWRVYHCISRKTRSESRDCRVYQDITSWKIDNCNYYHPNTAPHQTNDFRNDFGPILGMFPLYTLFPRFSSREYQHDGLFKRWHLHVRGAVFSLKRREPIISKAH